MPWVANYLNTNTAFQENGNPIERKAALKKAALYDRPNFSGIRLIITKWISEKGGKKLVVHIKQPLKKELIYFRNSIIPLLSSLSAHAEEKIRLWAEPTTYFL